MTQSERREYLIEYLLKEERKIFRQKMPSDKEGQENLLRSLMNVRMPKPASEEFLKVQDEYLKERNAERGITDIADLKPVSSDERMYIWQGDITTLKCDAIVNACNSQMLGCFAPMHVLTTLFTLMPELSSVLKCMKLCRSRDMKKRQARPRLHQHITCQQNTYFTQ